MISYSDKRIVKKEKNDAMFCDDFWRESVFWRGLGL